MILRDDIGIVGVGAHARAAELVALGAEGFVRRGARSAGGGAVVADGFTVHNAEQGHSGSAAVAASGASPASGRMRGGMAAVALAGRLANGIQLRRKLEDEGAVRFSDSDAEVALHLLARSQQRTFVNRLVDAFHQMDGGFAALVLSEDRLVAVRDPRGIRPLVLGRIEGGTAFASDPTALRAMGAEPIREVEPGEMVIVDGSAVRSVAPFARKGRAVCLFELLRLQPAEARLGQSAVHPFRIDLGRALARRIPSPGAELVVGVDLEPHLALGYAREAGLRWEPALRAESDGFVVAREAVERTSVVLIAGTTAAEALRAAVGALKASGAAEVHVRVATPEIANPCAYGVTAADGLRDEPLPGADSYRVCSLQELRDLVGPGYCDACMSGDWPVAPDADGQLPLFSQQDQ